MCCQCMEVQFFLSIQCCPGYVDTDMTSHKGHKTIEQGELLQSS